LDFDNLAIILLAGSISFTQQVICGTLSINNNNSTKKMFPTKMINGKLYILQLEWITIA
jgi:hypothetical protein